MCFFGIMWFQQKLRGSLDELLTVIVKFYQGIYDKFVYDHEHINLTN